MLSTIQAVARGITGLAASAVTQARLNAQYSAGEKDDAAAERDASSSGDDAGPRVPIGAPKRDVGATIEHRSVDDDAANTADCMARLEEADAADVEAMAAIATAAEKAAAHGAGTPQAKPAAGPVARSIPYPVLDASEARIGISACLLGHEVRYNKGHCHMRATANLLGSVFKFVPVCPEVDIGLGVPRPTLRIVGDGASLVGRGTTPDMEDLDRRARLYCPDTDQDMTDLMVDYARAKVADLRSYGCDGFVLKKDSPSCGIDRVKIYQSTSESSASRSFYRGFFARTILKEWPELPLTDEGRLQDEDSRDNFVRQVMCHQQWRQLDGSFNALVKFHETHKFVLLAQDPNTLKDLGRLLAKGKAHFKEQDVLTTYYHKFFMALKILVGRGRHVNVLQRICGYVKHASDPELYASLQGAIDDYKDGLVPLVVPLTLLQITARTLPTTATAEEGEAAVSAATKELLAASEYIKAAPRSLKAHTAISRRTKSTVPRQIQQNAPAGAAGDDE